VTGQSRTDVAVVGDEFDRLLETPHAAFDGLHRQLERQVTILLLTRLPIDDLEHDAHELNERNHEGAEEDRAEVVAQHTTQ
jgi:hypothetical protein